MSDLYTSSTKLYTMTGLCQPFSAMVGSHASHNKGMKGPKKNQGPDKNQDVGSNI
jgi:hypothetical protein